MSHMNHLEPMEQEYVMGVNIKCVEQSYEDVQSKGSLGNMTRKVVLLVPKESSQMYRFFNAWMGPPGKRIELLLRFDHPFNQYARACLMGPKSDDKESLLDEHHLYLMSYGLSRMIADRESLHDKEVIVTTCPASDDHADGCPTDGEGEGDDLYSGTRKTHVTGLETPETDRHGRKFQPLKG